MRKLTKTTLSVAAAAAIVASGAGFGISAANAATPTHHAASSSATIPAPAAAVPAVLGGNTAVALDSGFMSALTSLKLTPGVEGTAKLSGSTVSFPITGGSVVYWSPKSHYRPYVQGILAVSYTHLTLPTKRIV